MEEFINYNAAIKLESLGMSNLRLDINLGCFAYYGSEKSNYKGVLILNNKMRKHHKFDHSEFVFTPLYQQVFDWFREDHNLHCEIEKVRDNIYKYSIYSNDNKWTGYKEVGYKAAREKAVEKLIEIVESR